MHNVHFQLNLMGRAREAIIADRYPDFLREWLKVRYGEDREKWPGWIVEALGSVGMDLASGG